ncbi:CHAT domain-containing protein [Nostocaceae cyanobacterium CENA357]|uniref:CHAT domain-containing protein n=1 Tax=Atlanticothrix silvestris CENA357 TaxID=1725252 RepID=A0A8J7HJE7_9CYAN|nr:CHAT domain-containing protein [Atlanticothrix silvestris]MBH8554029.1 CHAT domain-containing protein [Atlanticothrix silvestris CENA357]
MAPTSRVRYPNSVKFSRRKAKGKGRNWLRLLLYFLLTLLCILASPVLAKVPDATHSSSQLTNVNITASQQGKVLYDAGRFAQAAQVLQQAAQEYKQQGDHQRLATTLSNLSLAYQQLGAWTQAQQAITESLKLLKGQEKSQNLQLLAQSLDIQGRLQLAMGQTEKALATWQETAKIYQQLKNHSGVVRSQINQAQAWRTQGFFRRAVEILEQTSQKLQSQPDSIEKAVGLRSLGDALLVTGDHKNSRLALQQSLEIAQRMQSRAEIGASLFSLGNNARIHQQKVEAIAYYKKTFQVSPSPLTKVQAQLNQLSLLVETKQLAEIEPLLASIPSQLYQLPPSRAAIYAQINYVQSLMKVLSTDLEFLSKKSFSAVSIQNLAQLLAATIQQSHSLSDQRAEAYALLSLGNLYEKNQQWSEAKTLTEQALILAQTSNASDIAYRLEWQLARLLRAQKDIKGAIAAYDAAIETLKSLRSDLVAVNQDVQFNFRDSVEPIYRQSVELLLQSQSGKLDEKILDKARQRIEALQLAELDNFFQEACLQGQSVTLDKVVDQDNPTAAILYPIILPNQFQVIVKIPNKPLRHYSTNISQLEVDKVLAQVQKTLVDPAATNAVKIQSQQIYNWLIKPIESELSASGVKTLVFVLDGALRNLPMSSLYDGQQFLVEKYAIALSVGLQLQNPKPLVRQQLRALTAGLIQPPPNFPNFAPLPGIESEVQLIASAGVSTTNLLNQNFTSKALENEVNTSPFNVIHLATHGQFSSRAENTFILAADGPINVTQFDTFLRGQDETQPGVVELLVLSACQTAAGDNRAALGLAGAAVRAGARSTLASLWQIDDESTALFVGSFYRGLKDGNITKAEALRRAQLQLLKHPNYHAPSFWSAYVLIGNWL